MFSILESYLLSRGNFSESEIDTIIASGHLKNVQKKQIILRDVETKRQTIFVCSGCLQISRIGKTGVEHIVRLATANCWVGSLGNYKGGYPGGHSIVAIEDGEIIQWSNQTIEKLQRDIPRFKDLHIEIRSELIEECLNRIFSLVSLDARDKYDDYIESYPELQGRVPLAIVATYLGVRRETLTRLRKKTVSPESI